MDFLFSILKQRRIVLVTRLEQTEADITTRSVRGVVWCVKPALGLWWVGAQQQAPAKVNILV